ncbi:hypothetical protein QTH97_33285 [Variovorax sp. J22R24]|uniref:hypothetical protein n=1 Tax=Variovorax gracilis TaxID=3053502 RepID=UPI002577D474|nr:hypothetical protein [Variovorax sp. J22R24]MDM0109831.1 hypothetical protein [Variovorax sp. J22R24]
MNAAGPTPPVARRSNLTRWGALLAATAVAAALAAFASGSGGFTSRLQDLKARSSFVPELYAAAGGSPELRALLLDALHNPQLLAKMQFALQNYPADARDVLIAFGGYQDFRQALLDYGEQIVPVIGFFQKTELKAMKLRFEAGRGLDWLLGKGKDDPDRLYGPEYRGLFAVEAIRVEGHKFLAQFRINDQGKAIWLITPQVITFISDFITSGMATVEEKIRLRKKLELSEIAWGAADVVPGVGVFKVFKGMKVVEAGAAASRAARPVTTVDRAALYGSRVLTRDRVARALKLSGGIAAAYITVRHPALRRTSRRP